ncbi:hypothetical protein [Escherichia coli]|nr:hypothetical protein [Escherichia coli]
MFSKLAQSSIKATF